MTRIGRFVVTGTDSQIASVKAALAACTYPVAERLPRDIPVTFADLTQYDALGLFWTDGRIQVEQTLPADRAQAIFLAEAWHAADQYILTSGDRAILQTAFHDGQGPDGHTWFDNNSYYSSMGETMMDVFIAAYSPFPPTGIPWDHAVTARVISALRGILTPDPTPPTSPPDTTPDAPTDPLAGFPFAELDAWAAGVRAWWTRRNAKAARAYLTWRTTTRP